MSKLNRILVCMVCLTVLGMAQGAAAPVDTPLSWIVWMDGNHYVPEWSYALDAVLRMMKPAEAGLLVLPGAQFKFVRQDDASQLQTMIDTIRPRLEQGANRLIQLKSEMISLVKSIEDGNRIGGSSKGGFPSVQENSRSLTDIKAYLSSRNQLLNLYGSTQKIFWDSLQKDFVPSSARLMVLVQQFDVPRVSRETVDRLMEGEMREWGIELQSMAPWEEKSKEVKKLAAKLKSQHVRVDGYYLKYKNKNGGSTEGAVGDRPMRNGVELSKALYSGVKKLSKTTGGICDDIKSDPEEIVESLK